MIPATALSVALACAVLPSSHPFQTQLEGLSFQPLTLLKSPRASHVSSFPRVPDTSCLPPSSKLCSSLCPLTSHFLLSYQHLFPNFPNPASNTSISLNTPNIVFSAHQPLPTERMFPLNIYISTLQISMSAEFLNSLKRKYVLVLPKSILWTGVIHCSLKLILPPVVGSPSATPLALH